MPSGHTGGREIFVNKQQRKTFSSEFFGMILKYWLWPQL
jgi:hypothetical protein